MRRSKIEVCVHFVWATKKREWFLEDPTTERILHRKISLLAAELGCRVLAVGGMPDHVHLVVELGTQVGLAQFARQVKGVSSRFANTELGFDGGFDWQDNYAAISISPRHLDKVVAYVRNQKRHHAQNSIWPELEETDKARPETGN